MEMKLYDGKARLLIFFSFFLLFVHRIFANFLMNINEEIKKAD
jgi:hypothetical protein